MTNVETAISELGDDLRALVALCSVAANRINWIHDNSHEFTISEAHIAKCEIRETVVMFVATHHGLAEDLAMAVVGYILNPFLTEVQ